MRYHDLGLGHAVIEIDYSPSNDLGKPEAGAELDAAIADRHRFSRRNDHVFGKTLQFGDRVIRAASPPALELELHVFWGDGGEPTRAVWLWSQTGRVAGWSGVGEA